MLSLDCGKPIGTTSDKKIIGIFDIDNEKDKKDLAKLKGKELNKKLFEICCKNHSPKKCKKYECCGKCPFYKSDESSEDEAKFFKDFVTKANIEPSPDIDGRFNIYISGPSGSGKSTKAALIGEKWRRVFPDKKIFIFSRTDAKDDPAYKRLNPIQFEINDDLIENPIDITKEVSDEGCLIIFDDIGTIHSDKLRKEVYHLITDSLEIGRKLNINLIVTNHLIIPNDKKFARTLLNEITSIIVFPKSGCGHQIKYALMTYFGCSVKTVTEILNLPDTRWVQVSKTYPQYCLSAHNAFIL